MGGYKYIGWAAVYDNELFVAISAKLGRGSRTVRGTAASGA